MASNKLSQELDIAGSASSVDNLDVSEESQGLGVLVPGQIGLAATLSNPVAGVQLVTGLTGMVANSAGRYLNLAGTGGNDGNFLIVTYNSASSVSIDNAAGAAEVGVAWEEREPYNLETDLNYARSDRTDIKGVSYDSPVPEYVRCTDQLIGIPANLLNIAGNTTDAKAFVDNLKFQTISVSHGDGYVTLVSAGNLKHADAVDITGVPINDGYDAGNSEATFVGITDDDGYATELSVLSGLYRGWRIYGRTRAGGGISPNSVEIEFRAVALGAELSSSVGYTWEVGQPSEVDVIIGYRTCLRNLSEIAFRKMLIFGVLYGGASGGTGGNLPSPTEYGQFLIAVDSSQFIPALPVVNDEGLFMVDENDKIVVVGE